MLNKLVCLYNMAGLLEAAFLYNYIHLPVVDMKEAPDERSKVVSQALFGEQIEVREKRGNWFSIMTPDGYSGWVRSGSFLSRGEPYRKDVEVTRLSAHVYSMADTEYGPLITLPFGTQMELLDDSDLRWNEVLLVGGERAFIQKGDVAEEKKELAAFSKLFLGLPYTWGGRSSFGFDCSGFVQMLYGRMGIQIPRDARQQILDPRGMPVKELKLGDLIFWGKNEGEIKHVGMCLEGTQFIHTSSRENKPYLRISDLSDREWNGSIEAFYPYRTARRFLC